MRRGKEKLLAGLLTVGMVVSSMFSSLTPVYAAEVPGTTESQVYEETDEAVVQSADETQEAKETETVENTEVSDKESDIESSESINHTPETESTESVESTEGGETQTPAETTAETEAQAETRCVVNVNGQPQNLEADEEFANFIVRVAGGAASVQTLEFVSGTVTATDLRSINKDYAALTSVKVNLDGDLTFTVGDEATTVLPSNMFNAYTNGYNVPKKLATLELKGFTALDNDSVKYLPALSQISMPNVTSIGKNVFYDCTSLTEINLSGVQTIGSNAFNGCKNLTKIHLGNVQSIGSGAFNYGAGVVQVTIDSVTAPNVDGGIFGKASEGSTLTIPAKALPSYLPEVVFGEVYTSTSEFEWNNLTVQAPDYATVTYTSPQDKYYNRAQLLAKGQSIGEKPFAETKNGYKLDGIYSDNSFNTAVDASYVPSGDTALYYKWGTITVSVADKDGNIVNTFELSTKSYNQLKDQYPALPEGALQWNTERDGSGKTILANTKIFDDITLYPIFEDITNVTVKVNDGAALGGANLALAIGKAGADSVTKLEVVSGKMTKADYLWMNKGIMDSIETLIIADGVESENKTVPIGTAQSAPNLHHLEIHGVETMESAAIMARNLHTLILPDVKKTGSNSWGDTTNSTVFIKTVDLSSIEELGEVSFSGQNQLPELNMPNLRSVGEGCFRNAGAVSIITNQVPEIGKSSQLKGNTFEQGSTITVPAQVYDEYMKTHDSEFLDSKKYVKLVRGKALAVVTVKINGTQYDAASVEDAVAQSGVDAGDVESIEFVSGTITQDDLAYMKNSTKYLTTLKMNLGENLKLTDAEGAETTELPAGAFKSTRLESVEIGGFTKVGARAFESCTKLENVAMPNVKEIEKDAFYRTDAYETIILPASLETMTDPGFGGAANGKKTLDVTMEGSVPPTISGRVFGDAKGGTVTVPAGALPNYLTNLDFAKWFNTSGDSEWGGLPVIDPAYHLVHYKGVNSWDNKYAYVKDGETVTEDRIPVFENGDKVLVGWNTEADGTGSALDAETEMNKEWAVSFTVYAQWAEKVPPVMDSVKAENGKVTIVLKDKPTKAPTLEDVQLQMNLNGTGNKDVKITGFTYDDDKTIVLTFDKVAQTDKTQKFTLTVTLDGKSMTSNEVTIEAKDLVREFVARLYKHLLGRKPDPAGLDSWTEVLKSKKESGAKVAQGFIESPEFKKRNLSDKEYIAVLYRTFLDREADSEGLAAWQKVLDSGMSRLYVFKGFAESDEFTKICNDYGIIRGNVTLTAPMDQNENVTKFIARCYKFCLGRKGDEAGINAWCNQILTGKNTVKQAAYGFVFSDEFKNRNLSDEEFVKTMYRVFMDREADPAGLNSWVKVLKEGKSREHVFNGFADSDEFKKLCESYGIK